MSPLVVASIACLLVVYCLLLVTITVVTTMVMIVVFVTKPINYDQLLVNKPPTNQQTRNCHVLRARVMLREKLFSASGWKNCSKSLGVKQGQDVTMESKREQQQTTIETTTKQQPTTIFDYCYSLSGPVETRSTIFQQESFSATSVRTLQFEHFQLMLLQTFSLK